LKKRSKKLLLIASSGRSKWANQLPPVTDKSFLVLFFKKELLPSFRGGAAWTPGNPVCDISRVHARFAG
jgi:hypothetical protein